jgi:hypothetical protein
LKFRAVVTLESVFEPRAESLALCKRSLNDPGDGTNGSGKSRIVCLSQA